MPPTNKIDWREKPKRWEFVVIAIVAVATIAQLVWLFSLWQSDTVQHKSKLEKIESWKSSMLSTAQRAGQCLSRLNSLDGQILSLTEVSADDAKAVLAQAKKHWSQGTMRRLVDVLPFVADNETGKNIEALLEEEGGQSFAEIKSPEQASAKAEVKDPADNEKWYSLCQAQKVTEDDKTYPDFKALLYRRLNPVFSEYFGGDKICAVDPFELRLASSPQDEAALLINREANIAEEAGLKPDDIVYGAEASGEFRAYSKDFLQSNKIFYDRFGKSDITGVFDDKAETLNLFDTTEIQPRRFAKSGLRYRDTPLLMDIATRTLWHPVTGAVVMSGQNTFAYDQQNPLTKRQLKVEKTTWSKWLQAHPKTSVLVVSI